LFHLGASMHDEPNLLGILANVIALNMPFAYVMGLVALRTRSLALPAVVHLSIDTTGHLWSSH
jgi:membrane protease YdiL (CAAX protease family)